MNTGLRAPVNSLHEGSSTGVAATTMERSNPTSGSHGCERQAWPEKKNILGTTTAHAKGNAGTTAPQPRTERQRGYDQQEGQQQGHRNRKDATDSNARHCPTSGTKQQDRAKDGLNFEAHQAHTRPHEWKDPADTARTGPAEIQRCPWQCRALQATLWETWL